MCGFPLLFCLNGPQKGLCFLVHKSPPDDPFPQSLQREYFWEGEAIFKVTPLLSPYVWESKGFVWGLKWIRFVQVSSVALCSKAELGILPIECNYILWCQPPHPLCYLPGWGRGKDEQSLLTVASIALEAAEAREILACKSQIQIWHVTCLLKTSVALHCPQQEIWPAYLLSSSSSSLHIQPHHRPCRFLKRILLSDSSLCLVSLPPGAPWGNVPVISASLCQAV